MADGAAAQDQVPQYSAGGPNDFPHFPFRTAGVKVSTAAQRSCSLALLEPLLKKANRTHDLERLVEIVLIDLDPVAMARAVLSRGADA